MQCNMQLQSVTVPLVDLVMLVVLVDLNWAHTPGYVGSSPP